MTEVFIAASFDSFNKFFKISNNSPTQNKASVWANKVSI